MPVYVPLKALNTLPVSPCQMSTVFCCFMNMFIEPGTTGLDSLGYDTWQVTHQTGINPIKQSHLLLFTHQWTVVALWSNVLHCFRLYCDILYEYICI